MKHIYNRSLYLMLLIFILQILATNQNKVFAQTCNCKDYIYLNDPDKNEVHKFQVQPNGGLVEIGSPWVKSTGVAPNFQPLKAPHGLVADLNGFLYIGDVDSFTGNVGGLVKMTCDGKVVKDRMPNLDNWGYNIGSVGNFLYVPVGGANGHVKVYDTCLEKVVDSLKISISDMGWGFAISRDKKSYYRTTGWYRPAETNKIIKGSLDGSGETVLYDSGNTTGTFMGITEDNAGNIYVVLSADSDGTGASSIVKVSSTGVLLGTSLVDATLTQVNGQKSGYYGARGIVWSSEVNKLYVGGFEDCVAVFGTDLTYQPTQSIGYVTGSVPKSIGILKECCPSPAESTIDTVFCNVNPGTNINLRSLLSCEGIICEGGWTPNPANTGLNYNACDQSVTVSSTNACGEFVLQGTGGSGSVCGAFKITLKIQIIDLTPVTISENQTLCSLDTPVQLTSSGGVSTAGTVTYQWQKSTTSCTSGFTDIVGATSKNYTPNKISVNTFFRLVAKATGTCSSKTCSEISNCITFTSKQCLFGSIGDFVFQDNDNSNTQSVGDTPISGVKVYLLNSTGARIDSIITDALGKYKFDSLSSGSYKVQFVAPSGTRSTIPNTGADETDSDADINGLTDLITIDTTKATSDILRNNMTIDYGIVKSCPFPNCGNVTVIKN